METVTCLLGHTPLEEEEAELRSIFGGNQYCLDWLKKYMALTKDGPASYYIPKEHPDRYFFMYLTGFLAIDNGKMVFPWERLKALDSNHLLPLAASLGLPETRVKEESIEGLYVIDEKILEKHWAKTGVNKYVIFWLNRDDLKELVQLLVEELLVE